MPYIMEHLKKSGCALYYGMERVNANKLHLAGLDVHYKKSYDRLRFIYITNTQNFVTFNNL